MKITKDDLRRFNNTKENDICFNDSYNLAKGYCTIQVFSFLDGIRKRFYGIGSSGKKLPKNIAEHYPEIELINN